MLNLWNLYGKKCQTNYFLRTLIKTKWPYLIRDNLLMLGQNYNFSIKLNHLSLNKFATVIK